eukprot:2742998-Rhodomonas_salina.1
MAMRRHPMALSPSIMIAASADTLITVRDSVGYVDLSSSTDDVDANEMTGVLSIDAASATGPVTADRTDPRMRCRLSSFHRTTWLTAVDGSPSESSKSNANLNPAGRSSRA